ncbi:formate dehydrogenase accessory sulfurtransferase FdhD [Methanohalophilus mahii]|uniref:Sulfur carrier protein FdhD n=1 Tax=Methanohalophilus mahii (strain ATCC 35705 / DSM 5219 / SLP) TaxID=547558 RepID=D5E6I8_METMS|nr:formate dehydrogenase accessory sulfurtransferase FdhD [Methanohalophilus mahii]ADE36776.1 formate dehydrogenase family accessory protein FdhD [Methanohalophilus mahii DSM 5219]
MNEKDWHFDNKPDTEITWKEEERDDTAPYIPIKCIEVKGEASPEEIYVDVVIEENYEVFLNGNFISSFLASPRELKEMAAGHLICEGHIENIDQIISIDVHEKKLLCKTKSPSEDKDVIISSYLCDCALWKMHQLTKNKAIPNPNMRVRKKILFDLIDYIFEEGKIWRRTGGAHSTVIATSQGEILTFCEDVSRASAVDKAIGKAALDGVKLNNCIMATSGRLSVTMVGKGVNARIPLMVSKAAPMDQGIRLARQNNMTLVGFARRPNLYIYSNPERLI